MPSGNGKVGRKRGRTRNGAVGRKLGGRERCDLSPQMGVFEQLFRRQLQKSCNLLPKQRILPPGRTFGRTFGRTLGRTRGRTRGRKKKIALPGANRFFGRKLGRTLGRTSGRTRSRMRGRKLLGRVFRAPQIDSICFQNRKFHRLEGRLGGRGGGPAGGPSGG